MKNNVIPVHLYVAPPASACDFRASCYLRRGVYLHATKLGLVTSDMGSKVYSEYHFFVLELKIRIMSELCVEKYVGICYGDVDSGRKRSQYTFKYLNFVD